jgi:hypothetical protein
VREQLGIKARIVGPRPWMRANANRGTYRFATRGADLAIVGLRR